ncbi:unnamed protein product, partial [Cuscuta europaea]
MRFTFISKLKWESEQSMTGHMYEECHTPTNLLMCLKEVEDDKIPALTVPFENLDWDVVGDDVGTAGVDMKAIEEVSMKELRKRKWFKSKYICSPFIAPAAKRLKVGGRDGEYDSFKAWVEEIDGIEPTVLHLDIPSSYPTNRTFFRELMDENEWLSSEHLDALVLLFRKSIKTAAYELMSPLFA